MDQEGGGARPVNGSEGVCIPSQQMPIKEMNSPIDSAKLGVKKSFCSTALYYSDVFYTNSSAQSSLTDSVCHGALRLVTNWISYSPMYCIF